MAAPARQHTCPPPMSSPRLVMEISGAAPPPTGNPLTVYDSRAAGDWKCSGWEGGGTQGRNRATMLAEESTAAARAAPAKPAAAHGLCRCRQGR